MKRCYLVLFFVIVYVLPSVAQDDYRPGYVVTNAGDTLKGTVLFRNGLAKHQSCFFKNSGGQVTTYQPADITAYGFSGVSFYEAVPDKGQFMEVLALGRLDLLAVVGNLFLRDSTGKVHALESFSKQTERDGETHAYDQKSYLGILRWQMADCNKVQSRIRETPLKMKPLTRLVSQYNECMGEKLVIAPVSAIGRVLRWGVVAMYGQGKVKGLHDNTHILVTIGGATARLSDLSDVKEFSTINAFAYGVYLNVGLPRVHEGLSLSIEGLLQQYELSSSHSYSSSDTRTYHSTISESVSSIKLPLYFQFEGTGKRKVQPLFFAGFSCNFNQTAEVGTISGDSEEDRPGHFTVTQHYRDVFPVQDFTLSVLGGAGVRADVSKRLTLELKGRYEWGGGPLQFVAPASSDESISNYLLSGALTCGYRF